MLCNARCLVLALLVLLPIPGAARDSLRPGDMLVSTQGAALLRVDGRSGEVQEIGRPGSMDLAIDGKRRIFGLTELTFGVGPELVEIDRKSLETKPLPFALPFQAGLALAPDPDNQLVVAGTLEPELGALLRVDPKSGAIDEIARSEQLASTQHLLVLGDGSVLASLPEGVLRVDPATKAEDFIFETPDPPSELAASLVASCDGLVLIGLPSEDGVQVLDPASGEIQTELFFQPATNFQSDLAFAPDASLLILGLHGLQRFDFERLRFEEVTERIGTRLHRMVVMPASSSRRGEPPHCGRRSRRKR